jgi:hypothetical protein
MAFAQAFLSPVGVARQRRACMAGGQGVIPARAFVIRNGRLDAEWAATERSTTGIASRAISTMIAASGINDVIRMYNATQRDGIDSNLAYIGSDFTQKLPAPTRATCAPCSTMATNVPAVATIGRRQPPMM